MPDSGLNRWGSRNVAMFALALTPLVLASCGGGSEFDAGAGGQAFAAGGTVARAVPVGVEVMGTRDLQVTLRGSANLRARQQVEVLPKQGGVVARILVEEGARVNEGQALALLDDAEWRLQARQSSARAQAARDALERGLALQERGLLADEEVERLRSEAEIAAAEGALAELRVENAQILAPISGIVTHRQVEQGQLVGTTAPAFTVADISRLEVDVGVPEREALRVDAGQSARILVEGTGEGVTGRVVRVRPVVDPGSGTVQVTVEVEPEQAVGLRAGQFVNVDIVTQVLEGRLALPRTAVLVDGAAPRVYRVLHGFAEEVEVVIGGNHGERVEIRSGIEFGDSVIIVGQDNLQPYAPVIVMEVDGVALAEPQPPPLLSDEEFDPAEMLARMLESGMSEEAARAAVDQMLQGAGGAQGGRGGPGGGGAPFGGGGRRGGPR